MIQPWDRGVLGAIEKAIQKSDIGLVPNVDGTVVRLNIPPAHRGAPPGHREGRSTSGWRRPGSRSATSGARRTTRSSKEERDGELGSDDAHREVEALQKLTDRYVAEVDQAGDHKEREVMEV